MMLTVVVCVALTLGNNFKFSIISQPIVASDVIVFGQVLETPALFVHYIREQWLLIPLALGGLVLPLWAIRFEQPLMTDTRWTAISVTAGVLLLWQIQPVLLMPRAPIPPAKAISCRRSLRLRTWPLSSGWPPR